MNTRFGRYDLLRPLGKGGMAEVFLARYLGPQGFEKELVIKRVLPRLADDRQLLRLFFEEAKTQVSFSHGNLVSVSDFGRVGNDYFIAMEHVRGADLASLLATERAAGATLSPALVAYLGIELCRGLAYVHRRGFVHRDLSPRNVLLSIDGEVKLSDFGLALAVAMETDNVPGLRGTVAYMAPEQARGERVDARSDLYALGLLLAEAVLGRSLRGPASGRDPVAITDGTEAFPADAPLASVLTRALRASPAHRFGWAGEMSAALEEALGALGTGREALVRELAARVEPLAARADVPTAAAPAPPAPATLAETSPRSGESYYRDQRSTTFIEDILGTAVAVAAPPPRRWGRWLATATLVLVAGGALVAGVSRRVPPPVGAPNTTATPEPMLPMPPTPPSPTPPPGAPQPTAPPEPAPAPSRSAPAPAPAPRAAARAAAPARDRGPAAASALGTGTLVIRCTPWCVPFVDDQPAGQDGRSFFLKDLAVGPHRVEARRLDDRQRQQITVRPAQQSALTFTFD